MNSHRRDASNSVRPVPRACAAANPYAAVNSHLFQLLEERFLRHVAESEHRTRTELGKEISDVRKEITIQTRWILVVIGAAAVLIPIMQRIMATLIP